VRAEQLGHACCWRSRRGGRRYLRGFFPDRLLHAAQDSQSLVRASLTDEETGGLGQRAAKHQHVERWQGSDQEHEPPTHGRDQSADEGGCEGPPGPERLHEHDEAAAVGSGRKLGDERAGDGELSSQTQPHQESHPQERSVMRCQGAESR
jgi:hypothetical protein